MSLYLVTHRDGDRRLWVAYEDDKLGRIYVYVPNTGMFHRNRALGVDYYVEQTCTYTPIDSDQAQELMREGVGRIDERVKGWIVEEFRADSSPLSPGDVLGTGAAFRDPPV